MDSPSIAPVPTQSTEAPSTVRTNSSQATGVDPTAGARSANENKHAENAVVRTRDPRSLQYQVDQGTQQIVATIVDEGNHLVIQQIPDAEVLRIAQAIDRMKGFLLEGKA